MLNNGGSTCCHDVPQLLVSHIVEGFCVINETYVYVHIKLSTSLYYIYRIQNMVSGAFGFPKTGLHDIYFFVHFAF